MTGDIIYNIFSWKIILDTIYIYISIYMLSPSPLRVDPTLTVVFWAILLCPGIFRGNFVPDSWYHAVHIVGMIICLRQAVRWGKLGTTYWGSFMQLLHISPKINFHDYNLILWPNELVHCRINLTGWSKYLFYFSHRKQKVGLLKKKFLV